MLYLRKATIGDMDLLFKWANDPVVRENSFNTNTISYDVHKRWFDSIMNDPSVLQYIMMDNDIPIGQIRLKVHGDEAEIGYSVAKEYRKKGYGHEILRLMADRIRKDNLAIKRLVAKVKPDNTASNRLFISEGYEAIYTCFSKMI